MLTDKYIIKNFNLYSTSSLRKLLELHTSKEVTSAVTLDYNNKGLDWIAQSLTPHPTQYRSFWRQSSQPIT